MLYVLGWLLVFIFFVDRRQTVGSHSVDFSAHEFVEVHAALPRTLCNDALGAVWHESYDTVHLVGVGSSDGIKAFVWFFAADDGAADNKVEFLLRGSHGLNGFLWARRRENLFVGEDLNRAN